MHVYLTDNYSIVLSAFH